VENWTEIRPRGLVDGLSKRPACQEFSIHWDTLSKVLGRAEPHVDRRAGPWAVPADLSRSRIVKALKGLQVSVSVRKGTTISVHLGHLSSEHSVRPKCPALSAEGIWGEPKAVT
jgi:hypothetical protein